MGTTVAATLSRAGVLLAALSAFTPVAQARIEVEHSTAGLDAVRARIARETVERVVARLPARWVRRLSGPVRVEWSDALPSDVHGRAIRGRVLIRSSLLPSRTSGTDSDRVGTRAAEAALVHEFAHLYDRSTASRLSRDPRLLELAGWRSGPGPLSLRARRNTLVDRSPDRYEHTRPAEFLAVNLEHFVLDAQYACRRPALHAYFTNHFGDAMPSVSCPTGYPFLQGGTDATGPALQDIDPARVHSIDYLLAEPDRSLMSRWGHSMLRVVICAPGRARGPACRLDLAHHRVLSFRAFVDDVQISNWKGLTGAYPSRLFVLPLQQVVDEYTKIELRGLQSVPLKLSRGEIATLLERAATLHWSYDGRYRFLTNNCATETYQLLREGVPRLADASLSSITPTGLLAKLDRVGAVDTAALSVPAEARRLGYYFESQRTHYQGLLDIARQDGVLAYARVEDWLALDPAHRRAAIERTGLRGAAALLVLEGAALRRQQQRALDALRERVTSRGSDDPVHRDTFALLDLANRLARPAALVDGPGYGLPQRDERDALAREAERLVGDWREGSERLRRKASEWLPRERRAALEGTEANLKRLGMRLRALDAAEPG